MPYPAYVESRRFEQTDDTVAPLSKVALAGQKC